MSGDSVSAETSKPPAKRNTYDTIESIEKELKRLFGDKAFTPSAAQLARSRLEPAKAAIFCPEHNNHYNRFRFAVERAIMGLLVKNPWRLDFGPEQSFNDVIHTPGYRKNGLIHYPMRELGSLTGFNYWEIEQDECCGKVYPGSGSMTKEAAFRTFIHDYEYMSNVKGKTSKVKLFFLICDPGIGIALDHQALKEEHNRIKVEGGCTLIICLYFESEYCKDKIKEAKDETLELIATFKEQGPFCHFLPLSVEKFDPQTFSNQIDATVFGAVSNYRKRWRNMKQEPVLAADGKKENSE